MRKFNVRSAMCVPLSAGTHVLGTIALLATAHELRAGRLDLISEIARRTAVALEIDRSRQASQMLFDASPTPMWVYDAESLAFLAVNDAAVRHYGYSREEFLAMTIKDIRPPEDVPQLLADVVGGGARLARAAGPGGTGSRTARSSTSRSPPAGSTSRAAAPRLSSPTTSASASGSSAGSPMRRRWRRSAASPAASRTTSTTC